MKTELVDLAHAFAAHAAALMPLLERFGYAGIFVAVLVEGFGIPAPGQTLLALGALVAARGELDIVAVLAIAWSATVIGNVIGYIIGRRAGRRLLLRIGVRRMRIRRVERFVRRYGPIIIVVARFVDGLRQLSSIVAGSMKMPWPAFLASVMVGATLWAGLIGLGAYYLEQDFHAIAAVLVELAPYAWIGAVGALLALLVYLIQRRRRV
jgi:membrane protein DedA with SNARE-associated domain